MNEKVRKIIATLIIILSISIVTGYAGTYNSHRPNNRGDAIGQEVPVGDGLPVLITCCVLLGIVNIIDLRKNQQNNDENELM